MVAVEYSTPACQLLNLFFPETNEGLLYTM